VSTADQRERSKRDDERSQHELSCPAISHRINRGRRSDSGEQQGCRSRVDRDRVYGGLLDHRAVILLNTTHTGVGRNASATSSRHVS
jgi:hypothetical protein